MPGYGAKHDKQFKKGQSGNPKGLPKGYITRAKWLDNIIGDKKDELLIRAQQMALQGNTRIMEVLLDRWLPSRPMDEPVPIQLKDCKSRGEKISRIYEALSNETITPIQAERLISTVEKEAKIIEVDELEKRITNLEGMIQK
jgi:hypothetical protein